VNACSSRAQVSRTARSLASVGAFAYAWNAAANASIGARAATRAREAHASSQWSTMKRTACAVGWSFTRPAVISMWRMSSARAWRRGRARRGAHERHGVIGGCLELVDEVGHR
jgi:hypothetical protein